MANGGGPFGIGNEILQGFIGNNTLRDYTHASKTFTTNSYELKPRFKFLFHVSFTINTDAIPYLRSAGVFGNQERNDLSLLVKTAELPKYKMATETLNQYNRKRIIQTKIDYQPVTLTFHDDGGDNARKLWYYYYSYYYKDPTQQYLAASATNGNNGAVNNQTTGSSLNSRDIYSDTIQNRNGWGYSGESWLDGTGQGGGGGKPPFFRDIRIYGLDQRKFAEYVLINPVISNWNHDTYNYTEGGGIMENTMTIDYETVKYYDGAVGSSRPDVNVQGFADRSHYDTTVSPIARPGGNRTIFGQGGLLDAGAGIIGDLQSGTVGGLIGAAQKAMRTYQTFGGNKGPGLAAVAKSEATALGTQVLLGGVASATRSVMNRPTGVFIPTPKTSPSTPNGT
jgi:hypothetical protein